MRVWIIMVLCFMFFNGGVVCAGTVHTYYSDEEKYAIIKHKLGLSRAMSRDEVRQGSQQGAARVIAQRIVDATGNVMVCNERFVDKVLVVFCAQHRKLQRYLHSRNQDFRLELQPFRAWGAAPTYIDWGW